MSFRYSENCERYEYISFDLLNPIVTPANNQFQNKSGYRFAVDSSGERHPFDWYNACFEIDFKINKMDNTNYDDADEAGIINGGHSMINRLEVEFNGVSVFDTPGVNHGINVKNLMDFSKSYGDTFGQSMFHYVDTATAANSKEFIADAANHIATRNANYNEGFAKRKSLLSTGVEATANITLPLNRYGFFEAFQNEIAPNGKVAIEVHLESDNNVIFRSNAAAAGRYIITKWVLWVPKMIFKQKGESLLLSHYFKPHSWVYLIERIVSSISSRQSEGTFKICVDIRKPRHVFIWALNSTKLNNQEEKGLN